MTLFGDPGGIAVRERRPGVEAGGRVGRDLEHELLPEPELDAGGDARPLEALDGDVLAEGAGTDRVPLGLERLNLFEREQTDRAVRSAVVLEIALSVALDPAARHVGG